MSYARWMPPQYSSELYHHGIKGMKWGVRKGHSKTILGRIKQLKTEHEEKRAKEWADLIANTRKKPSNKKEAIKQYLHEVKVTGDLIPSYTIKKGRKWVEEHSAEMDHMQLHMQLSQQAMDNAIATHQMMADMHMQAVNWHTSMGMY